MRHAIVLFAFACLACGETHVESPAELVPDPAVEPDPAAEQESETDPSPEPEEPAPRSGTVQVVDLPDEVPPLPMLRTQIRETRVAADAWGEPGSYYTVSVPDEPALTARINTFLEAQAQPDSEYPSTCRTLFAHPKVLAVSCEVVDISERGGSEVFTMVSNLEVTDSAVREFDLRDVISPTVSFSAKIRTACSGAMRRAGRSPDEAEERCREATASFSPSYRVSPRGIVGSVYDYDDDSEVTYTVPFSELDRGVYADTGLGQALAALEGASIVEIELPPGAVRPGSTASGIAFGEVDRAAVVLGRWMQLPAEARGSLLIAGSSSHYRLARPAEAEGDVEAVRTALGEPGEETEWARTARPLVVRTRVETSFRVRPGGDRTLILPEGTVLAVALGRIDRQESAMGQRGTWALTAAAPGVSGFTAGALLEEYDGCEPAAAPFLDGMPDGYRETAAASVVRAMVSLRRGGRELPAIAYGAAGRRNNYQRLGVSRIEIYERGEDCSLGRRIVRHDLEGNLFAMRFTSTTAHGGASLVLAGTYLTPRRLRWQLFELGADEPAWSTETALDVDVLTSERVDGEYYPVVIDTEPPVRVAWTGDGVEVR